MKMVGEIDESAWGSAFRKKYKNDRDWGVKMKKLFSKWERLIRNPEFRPFLNVHIGNDQWEV